MPTRIDIDDQAVVSAINKAVTELQDLRPMQEEIGELLVDSTRQRFATSTAPDGSRWLANSRVTIERFLDRKGYYGKTGKLNAKGSQAAMGKKPLIGRSRSLSTQIRYQVESGALVIGSSMEYARVQQKGAKQGEFGRVVASNIKRFRQFDEKDFRRYSGTKKGHPVPWGNIPARPFLGISNEDREAILDVIERRLSEVGK